jgi:uncharacterized protein (TIGR03067 family)
MKTFLAFVVAASSVLVLRASDSDRAAKEKDKVKLQGSWTTISIIDEGREEPKEAVKGLKLTIKGDKYIYVMGGRSFAAAYKIDPAKTPKEMDVTFEEGPQKGKTMLSIYSLDGDDLKICGGDKRPTEFTSQPNSQVVLFVFKRDKP